MSAAEFTAFLTTVCRLLAAHSADGALQFICMDWRHIGELLAAGTAVYTDLKNVCVWVKHNAGMGSLYRSQHELVFVFKHGREAHRNNIELGRFGRHRRNVWNYRGINSFGQSSDEGNLLALHPTVKPVNLVADAILDCSARDDVVLDVFLGSGTTVIAAERTGRRCRGLEFDPAYVDTIIKRWQAFTGDHAMHVASGRLFMTSNINPEQKMSNNNKKDYDIGYGKPPAATRFQKGQSGNPKGRPKGSLDMAAKLRAALTEQVTVTEDGKRKKITKVDAMFKQLANKAAAGDPRAAKLVFDLTQKSKDPEAFGQNIQIVMDEADARLL